MAKTRDQLQHELAESYYNNFTGELQPLKKKYAKVELWDALCKADLAMMHVYRSIDPNQIHLGYKFSKSEEETNKALKALEEFKQEDVVSFVTKQKTELLCAKIQFNAYLTTKAISTAPAVAATSESKEPSPSSAPSIPKVDIWNVGDPSSPRTLFNGPLTISQLAKSTLTNYRAVAFSYIVKIQAIKDSSLHESFFATDIYLENFYKDPSAGLFRDDSRVDRIRKSFQELQKWDTHVAVIEFIEREKGRFENFMNKVDSSSAATATSSSSNSAPTASTLPGAAI